MVHSEHGCDSALLLSCLHNLGWAIRNKPCLGQCLILQPLVQSAPQALQFNNYPSFNFSLGLWVQTNIRHHSFQARESMPRDYRWQIQLTICPAFSMTRHVCGQSWISKILQKVIFYFCFLWRAVRKTLVIQTRELTSMLGFHYSSGS